MKSKLCCLIVLIIYGCVEFDGNIPLKYRKQLNHYELNDTIYYRSNLDDLDTITIRSFDSISIRHGLNNLPFKKINLRIEYLPDNKWFEGIVLSEITKKYDSIKNQSFIWLEKEMSNSKTLIEMGIEYRDFRGRLNFEKLESTGIDTIKTQRGSLRDTLTSDSVIEIYWSKDYGMVGYKKNDGQIYSLVR